LLLLQLQPGNCPDEKERIMSKREMSRLTGAGRMLLGLAVALSQTAWAPHIQNNQESASIGGPQQAHVKEAAPTPAKAETAEQQSAVPEETISNRGQNSHSPAGSSVSAAESADSSLRRAETHMPTIVQLAPTERAGPTSVLRETDRARLVKNYGKLPLSFEANQGQTNPEVKYLSRGRGYTLFLTSLEAVFVLASPGEGPPASAGYGPHQKAREPQKNESTVVRMKLAGANPSPSVIPLDELEGKINHFRGNDPKQWHTGIPTFGRVKYVGIYPGIDLIYHGNRHQLEYDYVLAAGRDPKRIRLSIQGAAGMKISKEGDLILFATGGDLRLKKPVAYQESGSRRKPISASYLLLANKEVGFRVGDYNQEQPLVIDPVLVYSTYLGGPFGDFGSAIAVDASGAAYVGGATHSFNFPATTRFGSIPSGDSQDGFVTKINAAGTGLIFSTLIGIKSGYDVGVAGVAVNGAGEAYLTGTTAAQGFPVVNAYEAGPVSPTGNAIPSAFLMKLDASGSQILYSSLLDDPSQNSSVVTRGYAVAVDSQGFAYITGTTNSPGFPTRNGLSVAPPASGVTDGFVAKFDTTTVLADASLLYSSLLGGAEVLNTAIAVDSTGGVHLAGMTTGSFPVFASALQPSVPSFCKNFVAELTQASGLAYSNASYLGGWGQAGTFCNFHSTGPAIAADSTGNTYVAGTADESTLPPSQNFGTGSTGPFVIKLDPGGSTALYSAFLGDNNSSSPTSAVSIAVDAQNQAYLTGYTQALTFPTVNPVQAALAGSSGDPGFPNPDAFVSVLDPSGSTLVFSTYLGGRRQDLAAGIAIDPFGNVYVTGQTTSTDFPLANPYQAVIPPRSSGLPQAAFVTKISLARAPVTIQLVSSPNPSSLGQLVTFSATVAAATSGASTPTGTVVFQDGATPLGTVPLSGGVALLTTSVLGNGSHNVTATYLGDSTFLSSISAVLSHLVGNTPVGTNVRVVPVDTTTGTTPASITFSAVTQAGTTALATSSAGAPPPTGFEIGNPPVYFDLSTTALFTGVATVCINYSGISFTQPPQLFHLQSGAWVDVTTSVDTTNLVVCGAVSSFSPFALFQPALFSTTTTISAPGVTYGTPAMVAVSVGSSIGPGAGNVKLSLDGAPSSTMAVSNGSASFNLGVLNAGHHSLSAQFAAQGRFLASSAVGTLSVAQAPLTIVVNSAFRPYGANNPLLTGVITGLQNADPITASFTTTATPASTVGTYPTTPVVIDPQNRLSNYSLTIANGTLTVVPEATSLSVAISPPAIPVGQSTAITVTLTAPDMVIPIDPSVLAPLALSSPVVSDILTNSGLCALVPSGTPGVASCRITLTSVEPNGRTLLASFPGTTNLAPSSGVADLIVTAALESKPTCIKSDFRNVAVPGGSNLWFNSIFKVRDVAKQKMTISFFQSSVQFQYADASNTLVKVNQAMPDAKIVIDPSVTTASTTFDAANNVWITAIPFDPDDSAFLTGMPWLVPAGGIPGDIEPVTWCGTFASDTAGVDIGWRWAAAAYSSFSGDNTVLGVKPMDTDRDNLSSNHDRAGTPENFKTLVIPGARGKGGKNYTGTYSGSAFIE
jgi:hypothetical protein